MTVATYQPPDSLAVDNWLHSSITISPTSNQLQIGSAGSRYRTIFEWDISDLPDSATISSAELTLKHVSDTIDSTATIAAYRVTQTGMTESATWSTYDGSNSWTSSGGDYTATDGATASYSSGNDVVIDVAALAQDAIDSRSGLLRLLVSTSAEFAGGTDNEKIILHSSSATSSSDYPALVVTYEVGRTPAERIIIDILDAESSVTSLVSTRISALDRVEGDTLPCITVDVDSIDSDDNLTGSSSVDIITATVECHAAAFATAANVSSAVFEALKGATGTAANGDSYSVHASHAPAFLEPSDDGDQTVVFPTILSIYLEH